VCMYMWSCLLECGPLCWFSLMHWYCVLDYSCLDHSMDTEELKCIFKLMAEEYFVTAFFASILWFLYPLYVFFAFGGLW